MTQFQTLTEFWTDRLRRLPMLLLGFAVIAIGVQIMITTGLGLNPWGIFHSGLARITGVTFGRATQITGLTIILLGSLLKILPGIGTILNMIVIGLMVDLIAALGFLPSFDDLWVNILYFLSGNFLFSIGIYLYLKADLGSGPRDSLMLAVSRMTPLTAGQGRILIEITVAITGYFMGGSAGLGTILAAISGGLFIDLVFKLFRYDPKTRIPGNLATDYRLIRELSARKAR